MVELPIAERWRAAVKHLREQGERLQALTDALAPEWSTSQTTADRRWVARHLQAYMDYTVALNCVHALVAQELGGLVEPSSHRPD